VSNAPNFEGGWFPSDGGKASQTFAEIMRFSREILRASALRYFIYGIFLF